ncbi:hypothetical protein [Xanthomonas citri]|uniref:hypothetical protein n=3 Tax=Xanthomonas TaxID=338 RepID=UPI0003480298|nr:hypothetical protein [Xanthomonas citri]CEJ47674.1 hypothetical protein XAB3213_3960050 [Xanthomonas citri pv. bilvae]AUZ52543.1 hypothetical protein CLM98_19995 [Xanthomonas citri pv. citri]AYL22260.1 hypothetical protein COR42_19400 [Xanthomonas citri pv. citri]AYL26687.1 hypothetical protein CPA10_19355 [Xanthomonas citri pv. citri]QXF04332.1 hypothetical protein KJA71_18975 [Xanthomonas citri pv. citri]
MVLVDVSGLMEAGFMESGPSAIHVSILASSLHEDAPAAEPMGLENEVFCIEENGSAGPFFRTSDFDRLEARAGTEVNSPTDPVSARQAGFRPC